MTTPHRPAAETAGPPAPPDAVPVRTEGILERLAELRAADAPTHGGRVLSYVYDPGLAELDELASAAAQAVLPVNGLDPTTFTSVAVMERELVAFAREVLHGPAHGPGTVVGSVTSGGTESCLLAVKAARDELAARRPGVRPRLVAPVSAHAAFRKAAQYLGLELTLVPVDPSTASPPRRTSWPSSTVPERTTAAARAGAQPGTSRWSWCPRRRTRTASWTRWPRSPRRPRSVACPCTSTRASAGGCCRSGSRRVVPRCRRSTSPCRA
ncbi:pyridoxal-dependent decarboxylase [Cellulosimicrobium sp. CUA-896]|uniref:pyridoxal-dependent decarboxylase n=1 Tax=Cellulosimicrobium sp. CUA-896 TaxID=1517881 RepID=UPI000963382C|nr:hypothetical protein BJF88_09235 [Cellulosimicrobium sp. CUA-896]